MHDDGDSIFVGKKSKNQKDREVRGLSAAFPTFSKRQFGKLARTTEAVVTKTTVVTESLFCLWRLDDPVKKQP